jgi:hypothetical protein
MQVSDHERAAGWQATFTQLYELDFKTSGGYLASIYLPCMDLQYDGYS